MRDDFPADVCSKWILVTVLGAIRSSDSFVCCRENVAPRNMTATLSRKILIHILHHRHMRFGMTFVFSWWNVNLIAWRRSRRNPLTPLSANALIMDNFELTLLGSIVLAVLLLNIFFMAQHTSASNSITFLLCGSDEPTDELVCWLEPGLGVALALPDIDELCELPHTGLGMELKSKDDNTASSGVDLGLQNRFWKGKNHLQS